MGLPSSTVLSVTDKSPEALDHTPAAAVADGAAIQLGGVILAWANGDLEASREVGVAGPAAGSRKIYCVDGASFSVGDTVVVDSSAGAAVALSAALDGDADFVAGVAIEAKVASDGKTYVRTMPHQFADRFSAIQPFCYELDFDGDNGDTDEHTLIPAEQNRHGLILVFSFARVTEAFVGSSEDQGVATIYDSDDTALATITPTNGGTDSIGDIIVGTNGAYGASTGDALKMVAAGKSVYVKVTQQTSGGTPAGKAVVHVLAIPLL